MHTKTKIILDKAYDILEQQNPMTVRQVYYQLVSGQVIKNNKSQYHAVSKLLVEARKNGTIPWDWIEDRLRRPRTVSMWNGLKDFSETVLSAYRRDVWETQPNYFETWLEKDALSGIFEDALEPYGVTLNVGRGFDGWDSIHNAAERYKDKGEVTILYFGDFDPSGEDMLRSLRERLNFFNYDCKIEIIKCALNYEDIENYNLPTDFTKVEDTRRASFVKRFGDTAVELDALPVDVLRNRLLVEVENLMDLKALDAVKQAEKKDKEILFDALNLE